MQIVYNHQIFPDIDSFVEAYHNGTLRRMPHRPDQTSDTKWSTRIRPNVTESRDLDDLPGPRQVSFAGLRFRVNRALQYVSWMGWGMYLGFDRDMGLSLWDIRFKNERIVYEVGSHFRRVCTSLLPAFRRLHHKKLWHNTVSFTDCLDIIIQSDSDFCVAGNDPMQTTTAWLDRFFGMVYCFLF